MRHQMCLHMHTCMEFLITIECHWRQLDAHAKSMSSTTIARAGISIHTTSAPRKTESVAVVTLSVPSLNAVVVGDSCRVTVISRLVLLIRCQNLRVLKPSVTYVRTIAAIDHYLARCGFCVY